MKQYKYYLLTVLAGVALLLTACQDLEEPRNTVPNLGNVTVSNGKYDLEYTLSHYVYDNNNVTRFAYYRISQSPDMSNYQEVPASRYNNRWEASADMVPATTYYIQMFLVSDYSTVEGPVTTYTTSNLDRNVYSSNITTSGAILNFQWNRTDCPVVFKYSTSANMSGERIVNGRNNSGSYYYADVSGLQPYTTYYFYATIQLPNGQDYNTPVKSFTTTKAIQISTYNSDLSGNARFWIEYENSVTEYTYSAPWYIYVSEPADIYVFKPAKYSNSYKAIPLTYNEYSRFEYGNGKINPENTDVVNIKMNMWQGYYVVLHITPEPTDNSAITSKYISQVEIANAENSEAISSNATFDISTGTMTATKSNTAKWTQYAKISLYPATQQTVYFNSLIPTKFGEKEVKVNIILNNSTNMNTEVAPVTLPAANWEKANTYDVYLTVKYTRTEVAVSVDDITVTPWSNGGNEDYPIYD